MDLKTLPVLAEGACRIYFCRHGQTRLNAIGVVQGGSIDEPLNEIGKRQAAKAAQNINSAGFKADVIATSELCRAVATSEAMKGTVRVKHKGFNEMYYGEIEGMRLTDKTALPKVKEMMVQWSKDNEHYKLKNAESFCEVALRSRVALEDILEQHDPTHLVVVAHARLTKILIADLLGMGPAMMSRIPHDNCGISVVDVVKSARPFGYNKIIFNLTSHL